MNRLKRKLKRVKKIPKTLYFIIGILYLITFGFFTYFMVSLNDIETILRYIGLILLIMFFFFYLYKGLCLLLEKKYKKTYLLVLIALIITLIMAVVTYFISGIFGGISKISEKDKILYTSYLIALNDTEITDDSILGMINDNDDIEGNVLAKKMIKKEKLTQDVESYEDYISMLYDLYEGKVDGIFVSSNYKTLFAGEADFEKIGTETKIVYEYSEELANSDSLKSNGKSLDEPFTVLILGVDSEVDGLNANAAFNGDTLILATFNPKTVSATLFSIPRDTYVPIACRNGAQFKINSSAAYGTNCVIDTIEDLTGIGIDYYVKINFKGVVDLVNALDGIEVDVEEPDFLYNNGINCNGAVCEQNSDRMFDYNTAIYINPGHQTLDGEQALAYSRCRHLYISSDLARNQHQQDVITAIGQKALKIRNYGDFKEVLNSVINNISTNMSTSQILSSYNIFKKMLKNALNDDEFIDIQRTYLETYPLPVYYGGNVISALGYYNDSLQDIVRAMNVNLGKETEEIIKSFEFDINEEYSGYVAGKNIRGGTTNDVLANYIGSSRAEAENYCSSNSLSCNFVYVDDTSSYYNASYGPDVISNQNPHANTILKDISSVTFYLNGAKVSDIEEKSEE